MEGKELSDCFLDKVGEADKKTTEGYFPKEQIFLNELKNYFQHLKKYPDRFEEREGFLEHFKAYLTKRHNEGIDNFDQKIVDAFNKGMNQSAHYGFSSKLAFSVSLASAGFAIACHPVFWAITAAGLSYSIWSSRTSEKEYQKMDSQILTINILKEGVKKDKKKIEDTGLKELEEVLKNSEERMRQYRCLEWIGRQ